jgi:filamentous hemagglutinin
MGGLAAEAMGGGFKTGALAAGVNELLVAELDAQYEKMGIEDRKALLVMNSQVIGVLAAAAQGGEEKALQVGAQVAGNATQYNFLNHQDVDDLGEALEGCQGDCEEVRAEFRKRDAANRARLKACTTDCAQIRDELDMGSRALSELWQRDNTGITDEFLRNNINEWSSSGPRVATQVANAALEGKPGALSEIGHFLDQQGFNPFGINPTALGGLAGGKSSSTDTPKVAGPAKTGSAAGEMTPPLNQSLGAKENAASSASHIDQWSRHPKSIQDQMALQAAKEGQGVVIIKNLNDPKFKGIEKVELKVKSANGQDSVVHYVRDPKTGELMDFKFKKHSVENIKPWGNDSSVPPINPPYKHPGSD